MRIYNVHERTLPIDVQAAWELLTSLGGPDDRLWPADRWPRIRLEDGVTPGSRGRHSFVRYTVVGVEPERRIRFRLRDMPGFEGEHAFELAPAGADASVLRHILLAELRGPAVLYWRAFIGRLHDALLQDLLDRAEGRPARGHAPLVAAARTVGRTRTFLPGPLKTA
jgi:hypothetical protein